MIDIQNRHKNTSAVITGGAQGVGYAIAERLIAEGCKKVLLVGRDAQKGASAAEKLKHSGADVQFLSADLTAPAEGTRIIDSAVKAFGNVTALVNAAACAARGSMTDTSIETWNQLFDTNARGPFFLMQAFIKHRLDAGGSGSVVNILSQCIHCGQSYLAPYSASKSALAAITKNAANAHAKDRIRANAIAPGWMDTPGEDMTQRKYHGAQDGWLEKAEANQPMGQLCKPHQLAGLAAYLLSDEDAGVLTGAIIDYDQNVAGAYPE